MNKGVSFFIVIARERSDRGNYIFYIVLFISALTE